jgi:hypothetical protein
MSMQPTKGNGNYLAKKKPALAAGLVSAIAPLPAPVMPLPVIAKAKPEYQFPH